MAPAQAFFQSKSDRDGWNGSGESKAQNKASTLRVTVAAVTAAVAIAAIASCFAFSMCVFGLTPLAAALSEQLHYETDSEYEAGDEED